MTFTQKYDKQIIPLNLIVLIEINTFLTFLVLNQFIKSDKTTLKRQTKMNYQNPQQKTIRERLDNTKTAHLMRVLEKLVNGFNTKDGSRANTEILERFKHQSDWSIKNHIFSYYNENDISTVHWALVAEYKALGGEKPYKKGRPVGAKNRYRPNYRDDNEAVDALKELGGEIDEPSLADEVNQIANAPQGNVMIEADAKKEIATLFGEFLARYSQDIDGIKNELNQKFNILTDGAKEAISKYVESIKPNIIEIKSPDPVTPNINMGVQHKNFADLLAVCNSHLESGHRLNVWVYGPAGTGKSTAAENVAKALELDFYAESKLADEVKLFGFIDAGGKYHSTNFRRAFEFGGVICLDEVDGSLPDALIGVNGALANGHCAFPDKMVARHPDFVCICAANTTGTGGTIEYVGRFQQDAAFNDRFAFIEWPLDDALEESMINNKEWLARVRHCRARLATSTIKGHMITPRASLFGQALLKSGLSLTSVEKMTLKKGLTDAQWRMIN